MGHAILLVDDEPKILTALARVLHTEPYDIVTAGTAEQAIGILEHQNIDLILSDEKMPGMSGTKLLAIVAEKYPDIIRIVLTGDPDLSTAIRAINEGKVYQFITKPCNEIDLAITIRRALEQKDLLVKSRELLELSRQQSVVIDQARVLRRLRDLPCSEQSNTPSACGKTVNQSELLSEIKDEVHKGKEVLRRLGEGDE